MLSETGTSSGIHIYQDRDTVYNFYEPLSLRVNYIKVLACTLYSLSGEPGLVDSGQWTGCSPCMLEVEGSTPTGGTCPNDFSDSTDQDICTQWALSWKIVLSEWRSMIAVSLNVGCGVRLIKPAKLCMCTQNTTNTTRTDAQHRVCAAMVPYRWATRGNVVTRIGIHTHIVFFNIVSASIHFQVDD